MAARVLIDLTMPVRGSISVVLETAEDELPVGLVTDLARVIDHHRSDEHGALTDHASIISPLFEGPATRTGRD